MYVTLNELILTSSKAALGVGSSIGAAEDISSSVAWLAARGLSAASLVLAAIRNVDEGASEYGVAAKISNGVNWRPEQKGKNLSAALLGAGPASLCWALLTKEKDSVLSLESLDIPMLQLPYFARIAEVRELSLCVKWHSNQVQTVALCNPVATSISFDESQNILASGYRMEVRSDIGLRENEPVIRENLTNLGVKDCIDGYGVDQNEWKCLCKYARQTLVTKTVHSRAFGAGSGLSDND